VVIAIIFIIGSALSGLAGIMVHFCYD